MTLPTNPPQQWRPFLPTNTQARVQCQLCEKFGDMARVCRSHSHNHLEAKANFVTRSTSTNSPWILDTGASHHVTSNSRNIQHPQDYNGPDEIIMSDGNTISIIKTSLSQLYAFNSKFNLHNTLCAPAIKRNLISVSQFCIDNLTLIEFFPHKFFVKDLSMACNWNKDDLYEWPSRTASKPSCHTSVLTQHPPMSLWRQRLGHPNSRALKFILDNFCLSYSKSEPFNFSNSCSCNQSHMLLFSRNSLLSDKPVKIIFSDLWGPSPILSLDKKLYYVIFVD